MECLDIEDEDHVKTLIFFESRELLAGASAPPA